MFRGADLENAWDLGDLQKLDGWNGTESRNSNSLNTRQIYPTINPGDTNELPGPITGRPIPSPPPGCLSVRGQFPSPTSCSNYLNCWDETVTEQSCPDGLFFNDVNFYCDYDYNVNCGNRPVPTPSKSNFNSLSLLKITKKKKNQKRMSIFSISFSTMYNFLPSLFVFSQDHPWPMDRNCAQNRMVITEVRRTVQNSTCAFIKSPSNSVAPEAWSTMT